MIKALKVSGETLYYLRLQLREPGPTRTGDLYARFLASPRRDNSTGGWEGGMANVTHREYSRKTYAQVSISEDMQDDAPMSPAKTRGYTVLTGAEGPENPTPLSEEGAP